jgi:tyrosinase
MERLLQLAALPPRSFNRGSTIGPWTDADTLYQIVSQNSDFYTFSRLSRGTPHSRVHNNIGGDMGTMIMRQRVSDHPSWARPRVFHTKHVFLLSLLHSPIFWLHHAFIDKVWADWQALSPGRVSVYNGFNSDGSSAAPSDPIPSYTDTAVRAVLDNSSPEVCVVYEDDGTSDLAVAPG